MLCILTACQFLQSFTLCPPSIIRVIRRISMSNDHLESDAFYRATLNSEWYRIIGLLGVLGVLVLYTFVRGAMVGGFRLLWIQTGLLVLVIAHEVRVLYAVSKALRTNKDVSQLTWAVNVVVESQLPTLALALLLVSQWMTPYQVLVAPAVLIYFLIIILSTLRLSVGLSILTGLMSALGYLCLTFYIEGNFEPRTELGAFPLSIYIVYASLIFTAGVIAAVVTGQIRSSVVAALRKAEVENELKAVNHDLDIARSIQQGLLPAQSPSLDNYDLAGWNQPANQTGGDYFDWQSLPDGRLAISLGDATGHGIGPALVSTSCRAYARASFITSNGHHQVLERLNRLLADDLSSNRFVTFAVVFLNPEDSAIEILSAGHGPILWYKYSTDKFESLEAQGIPLGMIAGISYEKAQSRRMAPGDMLVLVTDGFYEWENPQGEEFGVERLETTIRQARDSSAAEVIAKLRKAVESFCQGTEQKDDLTAVVLKRKTL
jgi:serine phosphatase RsbU (regulator of sigma subunit)